VVGLWFRESEDDGGRGFVLEKMRRAVGGVHTLATIASAKPKPMPIGTKYKTSAGADKQSTTKQARTSHN
jgi:hypothetical protein